MGDYKMNMRVTLEDLYNGHTVSTNIRRRVVCKHCSRDPKAERCKGCTACPGCVKMVQKQMGNMIVQQQVNVPSKERCKEEATALESVIEVGMADGSEIRFERMSEQKPGEIPGDV